MPCEADAVESKLALGGFRDGDRHRHAGWNLLRPGERAVIARPRIFRRPQLLEQAVKLHLFVDGFQQRGVELLCLHGVE